MGRWAGVTGLAAWPPGALSSRRSSLEVQGLTLPEAQCSLGQEWSEGAGQREEGGAPAAPAPHSLRGLFGSRAAFPK